MPYLLPHILDASAERFSSKEAFRFGGQGLTYEDLVLRSNALAGVLQAHGVERGDRVGIFQHKGLTSAIALYGIMKAGAAYVPLDPKLPTARLAAILRDSGIRHLVTADAQRPALEALASLGLDLQVLVGPSSGTAWPFPTVSWDEVYAAPSSGWFVPALTEQDMAYLMYTSGSTGEPKGIIHTHASGFSYAHRAAKVYGLTDSDRLSGFPPLHFDQSTFDYFSGPLAGATTVIIPEMHALMPASLSKLIEEERLSVWYSVPFALVQLLLRGILEERDLTSLRWVLFGGEAFPPKHLRALMQQWPHARFSNVYGPAEVNQCTFYHVPPLPEGDDTPLPIGAIWPNAEGLVLGDDDHALPDGMPGEFVVRTPTMMHGYWNRPDLNERAFFYRHREGGLTDVFYRTGDLVVREADGTYHFLGRKDRQIKTRGYRVELDEVEAVLVAHPAVDEAAVFAVEDADATQSIHAAVLPHPGASLTRRALLQHAATLLPRYALPTQIDFVDSFPRTSSGKINRRALQAQALPTL